MQSSIDLDAVLLANSAVDEQDVVLLAGLGVLTGLLVKTELPGVASFRVLDDLPHVFD